jgi:hypothetical protein
MATLKLNNTTVFTETNGIASIPTGVTIGNGVKFPAGHTIQTVQETDITWDGQSVNANSTLEWISKSITRKQNNSKILVTFSGHYGKNTNTDNAVRLQRGHNSVNTLIGNGEGSTAGTGRAYQNIWTPGTDTGYMQAGGSGTYGMTPVSFQFLDTLPTSDLNIITYTVLIWCESAMTIYRNGDGWRGSDTQSHSTMAKLLLQEIAV